MILDRPVCPAGVALRVEFEDRCTKQVKFKKKVSWSNDSSCGFGR